MDHEKELIGLAVTLAGMCGLLIRYLVKRKTQSDVDENSTKRLARIREEQQREREKRLHQHFRDYREFSNAMRSTVKELGFRATEMEKDVAELKERFEAEVKNGAEYRERMLAKLSSMEGAARAFATFAQSARMTLEQTDDE